MLNWKSNSTANILWANSLTIRQVDSFIVAVSLRPHNWILKRGAPHVARKIAYYLAHLRLALPLLPFTAFIPVHAADFSDTSTAVCLADQICQEIVLNRIDTRMGVLDYGPEELVLDGSYNIPRFELVN